MVPFPLTDGGGQGPWAKTPLFDLINFSVGTHLPFSFLNPSLQKSHGPLLILQTEHPEVAHELHPPLASSYILEPQLPSSQELVTHKPSWLRVYP